MNFDVVGPFVLSRHGAKQIITDQSLKELGPELEAEEPGLSDACGCYVFGVRAGRGMTPYYVGQACKRSILKEALNPSNREKYNKVISESKGNPIIFFIPMRTPRGKLRKRSKGDGGIPALDFLESWFISMAIEKNPDLINIKETKFLRSLHVTGVFNPKHGEATADSTALRKTLFRGF